MAWKSGHRGERHSCSDFQNGCGAQPCGGAVHLKSPDGAESFATGARAFGPDPDCEDLAIGRASAGRWLEGRGPSDARLPSWVGRERRAAALR